MNMLSVDMANATFESTSEAFGYALSNSVFGFAVVFGVLILIWGVMALMKVFFYTIPNAKKNPAPKATVSKSVESSNAQTADSFTGVVAVQDSNASIAAAIIAAVSAFRAEHGESVNGFRVVSFKKRK